MILVTGGTGRTGSEVVRALLARGADLRLYVRDRGKARTLFGDGVEIATGDPSRALDGADGVFLSFADDPARVAWETRLIDAAAGTRIVRLSTIGAVPGAPVPFWDWHGRVDEHLRASRASWTILRSSFFMTNVLSMEHDGRVFSPAGDARIAMVDPRDVAEVAAALLVDGGHVHETVVVTGPAAITFAEAGAALGAEVVDVPAPPELAAVFEQLRAGAAAEVTDAVERITGSPARGFGEFARATAAAV